MFAPFSALEMLARPSPDLPLQRQGSGRVSIRGPKSKTPSSSMERRPMQLYRSKQRRLTLPAVCFPQSTHDHPGKSWLCSSVRYCNGSGRYFTARSVCCLLTAIGVFWYGSKIGQTKRREIKIKLALATGSWKGPIAEFWTRIGCWLTGFQASTYFSSPLEFLEISLPYFINYETRTHKGDRNVGIAPYWRMGP